MFLKKNLCFDNTIIPKVYVFGDTLNMNICLITTKCTHTEITLLHIAYEQLRLYLFVPDSSRHDYDQDEVIHLSWIEGKIFLSLEAATATSSPLWH